MVVSREIERLFRVSMCVRAQTSPFLSASASSSASDMLNKPWPSNELQILGDTGVCVFVLVPRRPVW